MTQIWKCSHCGVLGKAPTALQALRDEVEHVGKHVADPFGSLRDEIKRKEAKDAGKNRDARGIRD